MKMTTALLLLGSALCSVSPANADDSRQQKLVFGSDTSLPQEMSSRHRHWRVGRVVAPYSGFTHAPTLHKAFHDKRWPYVSWIGARDSLYVPGPLVTFVRYGSY